MSKRFALLLCTYNEPTRTAMYEDVISWWMKHSCFDIYVVDSYNKPFTHPIEYGCKMVHFDQTKCGKDYQPGNSTALELLSLREALQCFSDYWSSNYSYVIKLTGKYTLPTLEETLLKYIDKDTDLMIQNKANGPYQHCEMVVYKADKMTDIVNALQRETLTNNVILEHALGRVISQYSTTVLPDLINLSTYKRDAGDYMADL